MSEEDRLAIRVQNLGKCYQIYAQPHHRLLQMLVRNRKKYFQDFWALKDVSFDVGKGETVGIVGRNGSGKSTLLQLICGTLNPTYGSVQANGRIAALLELGSGFNPEFTGRENVYLNGSILGLSQEDIEARYDDIAAFADIGEFIERPVKTYSSGMQLRLAFAVQATVDPDILIVDEALAVGDEKFQRKCFARLQELKSRGTAILFVSHAAQQVVELCDKAMWLEQGQRVIYGPPLPVTRAYQKLIYAPQEIQGKLIQEFCDLDQRHRTQIENIDAVISAIDVNKAINDASLRGGDSVDSDLQTVQSTYDPGLIPDSTVTYPKQGAEIASVKILNSNNDVVNILQLGHRYQFVVSGRFLSDLHGIHFGIHIRTISGLEITGQRYPARGNDFALVRSGQEFRVRFEFTMALLPGTYFVGAGVWSNLAENCAHRILDALMFRIEPSRLSKSFGYVDIASNEPVLEWN